MVKIRALVPLTHPKTQEQFAAGAEVDVADDVAADWRADGKISLIEDEQKAAQAAQGGEYSARVGRAEAAQTQEVAPKAPESKKR